MLSACMLLGTGLLFSSCGKQHGEIKLGKSMQVDLSTYAVVYAETEAKTATYKEVITDFTQCVSALTGVRQVPAVDARAKEQAQEILIGDTARKESEKALDRIDGDGFVIEVNKEKIVIAGTTPLYTMKALDYFKSNYLAQATAPTVTLHKRALAGNCASICIADADGAYYTFLLDKDLDSDERHYVVSGAVGDYRDYPCIAMSEVTETVKQLTGVRAHLVQTATDDAPAAEKEFSMGMVDREENRACLAQLGGNGYGIFIREGRVMATAWNDAALSECKELLLDLLREGAVVREDGKKAIMLPADFTVTGTVGEAPKEEA